MTSIITFDGLQQQSSGTRFTNYTESGLTVSALSGNWVVGFGHPPPGIDFINPTLTTQTASISVTDGGFPFKFSSIELFSSTTAIPYTFTGLLNGSIVETNSATVPMTFGNFVKVGGFQSDVTIDTLQVTLSNPAVPFTGNPVGLDNIEVAVAPQTLSYVSPGKFDGTNLGEIVFQNAGTVVLWPHTTVGGNGVGQSTVLGARMGSEWSAFGTGAFSFDGNTDLLWTNGTGGQVTIWQLAGPTLVGLGTPSGRMGPEWTVAGTGDFNGDRSDDVLWVSNTGNVTIWGLSGTTLSTLTQPAGHMGAEWSVAATGDFNGDRTSDVLWVSNTGAVSTWTIGNGQLAGFNDNIGHMGSEWHVIGTGDVYNEGTDAIVWVDTSNDVQVWRMSGGSIAQIITPSGHNGPEWHLEGAQNFNANGKDDLLWLTSAGGVQTWELSGSQVTSTILTTPQNQTITGL
jgi:hypothetical protein